MKNVSVLAAKRLGITCCHCDSLLLDAAQTMVAEDISCLAVIDDRGYLQGIITRTDVVRAALEHPDGWREALTCDWMTSNVITVKPSTSLASTAHILQAQHIHRVVVVEEEEDGLRPIAVVSDSDIVYHLVNTGSG